MVPWNMLNNTNRAKVDLYRAALTCSVLVALITLDQLFKKIKKIKKTRVEALKSSLMYFYPEFTLKSRETFWPDQSVL